MNKIVMNRLSMNICHNTSAAICTECVAKGLILELLILQKKPNRLSADR